MDQAGRNDEAEGLKKHSIKIAGHATSISLEEPFWEALNEIAKGRKKSLSILIAEIDAARGDKNLSSALRVFVLEQFRK